MHGDQHDSSQTILISCQQLIFTDVENYWNNEINKTNVRTKTFDEIVYIH